MADSAALEPRLVVAQIPASVLGEKLTQGTLHLERAGHTVTLESATASARARCWRLGTAIRLLVAQVGGEVG